MYVSGILVEEVKVGLWNVTLENNIEITWIDRIWNEDVLNSVKEEKTM